MNKKPFFDKKVFVSLFIVAVMVLSTFGFILSYSTSESRNQEYNGHKFRITELGITTKIDGKEIFFNYFPTQLESINMSDEFKQMLKETKMLTVTYDPNSEMAGAMAQVQYQAEETIPEYTEIFIEKGLTNNTGYTTKKTSCEDATENSPVLELREGNTTELAFENNCIIATAARENDFFSLYERIFYTILGIME